MSRPTPGALCADCPSPARYRDEATLDDVCGDHYRARRRARTSEESAVPVQPVDLTVVPHLVAPNECRVASCDKPPDTRGLCQKHYDAARHRKVLDRVALPATPGKATRGETAKAERSIPPLRRTVVPTEDLDALAVEVTALRAVVRDAFHEFDIAGVREGVTPAERVKRLASERDESRAAHRALLDEDAAEVVALRERAERAEAGLSAVARALGWGGVSAPSAIEAAVRGLVEEATVSTHARGVVVIASEYRVFDAETGRYIGMVAGGDTGWRVYPEGCNGGDCYATPAQAEAALVGMRAAVGGAA